MSSYPHAAGAPQPDPKPRESEMSEYHWRHGIAFRRLADGAVRMQVGSQLYVIAPEEWASIVSAVTPRGDNAETYQRATELHGNG